MITEKMEKQKIFDVLLYRFDSFRNHPFEIRDDEEMRELERSIAQNGIMEPVIARPAKEAGRFEIISGHRRCYAASKLDICRIPTIIKHMEQDEAVIAMVDSNLHRSRILPSEKANAYKMKYDAMLRIRQKEDPMVLKESGRTIEILAKELGESPKQVQRYIRIASLDRWLLFDLDDRKLSVNPAYELSFLRPIEQGWVVDAIEYTMSAPSLSQAQRMKTLSQLNELTEEKVLQIMEEVKKNELDQVTLKLKTLYRYFPVGTPVEEMRTGLIKILDEWKQMQTEQNAEEDEEWPRL